LKVGNLKFEIYKLSTKILKETICNSHAIYGKEKKTEKIVLAGFLIFSKIMTKRWDKNKKVHQPQITNSRQIGSF
jgi:hypothetical protein